MEAASSSECSII